MNPCGMWVDMLHSFYQMPVCLNIGGQKYITPIIWYKAPKGARRFPHPSFINSRVWSQEHQLDGPCWGERGFPRTWNKGINPGFKGQHYVGQREWFETGELPASVLTDPLPIVSEFCCTPPAANQAVLVLQGSAIGAALPVQPSAAALVLTGTAICTMSTGPKPSYSSGATGSVSPHMGPETDGCVFCPSGAPVTYIAHIRGVLEFPSGGGCADLNADIPLTYAFGCTWNSAPITTVFGEIIVGLSISGITVNLESSSGPLMGNYSAPAAGWNCLTPITLTLTEDVGDCYFSQPTITVEPA